MLRLLGIALILATLILQAYPRGSDLISDPSRVPIIKTDRLSGERFRVLADFNMDGLTDMALSDDMSTFGTGGIGWKLYMADTSGMYRKYGTFFTKPRLISLERLGSKIRMWTYGHISAQEGILACCRLGDTTFTECRSMVIHPGDGGTEIGNEIMKAVFRNSDVPLRVQRSATENGEVKWIDTTEP